MYGMLMPNQIGQPKPTNSGTDNSSLNPSQSTTAIGSTGTSGTSANSTSTKTKGGLLASATALIGKSDAVAFTPGVFGAKLLGACLCSSIVGFVGVFFAI
jgi:hypothetical protein